MSIDLTNEQILEVAKEYSDSVALSKKTNNTNEGVWQTRRFAQKDWILNIRVYRYYRRKQRFEVALFRSKNHEDYIQYSGVMGGLIFLLSESYNQTGKMAVEFIGPPEGENASIRFGYEPQIPECITEYLDYVGITVANANRITDGEGRRIYMALSGLNEDIHYMASQRYIDVIQLCFVSQRNIWTNWQIQSICKYAFAPEKIFLASLLPENRLHFISDLYLLRAVYMVELLLFSKFRNEEERSSLRIDSIGQCQFSISSGIDDEHFVVTVIPLDYAPQIADLLEAVNSLDSNLDNILVFPKDYDAWSVEQTEVIFETIQGKNIETNVSIDRVSEIDHAITNKLKQSASSKKPPPIRAD